MQEGWISLELNKSFKTREKSLEAIMTLKKSKRSILFQSNKTSLEQYILIVAFCGF